MKTIILATAAAISWLTVLPAYAAPLPVTITFNKNDKGAASCARALDETKQEVASDISINILPQQSDRDHYSKGLKGNFFSLLGYDWASSKIAQLPFLFRDAEHFQAFLTSDIYADFAALSAVGHDDAIAHAYGGFFQIFSYEAAVTQPSHFHNRYIAGIAQAPGVYAEFGGKIGIGLGFMGVDVVAEDARMMAEGHRLRNMVEGLLISAFENKLDKNARFVNLISSTVNTIYFETWNGFKDLPARTKLQIQLWARAAATRCSAENYQVEVDVLERLKQAGLKIVPFNRRAMYEAGMVNALKSLQTDWTANDLDRIASLGKRDPAMPLPSQLLRRAGPEAIKREQEASIQRQKNLRHLADRNADERIEALGAENSLLFAQAASKIGPPKRRSYQVFAELLSQAEREEMGLLSQRLARAISECERCEKRKGWLIAARGFFLAGRKEESSSALSEALKESPTPDAQVVWTAIAVGDNRAKEAALKFLSASPELEIPNDTRLWNLMRAAVLLAEAGEVPAAEKTIALAKEILGRYQGRTDGAYLHAIVAKHEAAVIWASGNSEKSWPLLVQGLQQSASVYWPVMGIDESSHHLFDYHLLGAKLEQADTLVRTLGAFKPVTSSSILAFFHAVENEHEIKVRVGQKTRVSEHLSTIQKQVSQLPPSEREFLLELVEKLKRKVNAKKYTADEISRFSVGDQVYHYERLIESRLIQLQSQYR